MVFRNRHCTKGSVSLDHVNTVWKRHGFNIHRFTLKRKGCVHEGHITANALQWWNKDVEKSVKETGWEGQRTRVGNHFCKGLAPRIMGLWINFMCNNDNHYYC